MRKAGRSPLTAISLAATAVCNEVSAKAQVKSGSGLPPDGLAEITEVAFSNNGGSCPATGGVLAELRPANLPWKIDAESYDTASGKAIGKVVGVAIEMHSSDGCDATFSGPEGQSGWVRLVYDNGAEVGYGAVTVGLALGTSSGTNLVVTEVDGGCDANVVGIGDEMQVTGQFFVDPNLSVTSS